MSSMCPYVCDNKTVGGYCRTTFCINPTHSNIGTAQYGQSVQKCIDTNADLIRNMTDEEMAKFMERTKFYVCKQIAEVCGIYDLEEHWDKDGIVKEELEWLRQPSEN